MTADASARIHAPAGDESTLRTLLGSDDPGKRRDAALALVERGDDGSLAPATVAALARRVSDDEESDVRQFAVEALGVVDEGEDAIRAALDDGDEWVRAEATVALSRVGDDLEPLRVAVREDDSGWVRRNAIIALAKRGLVDDDLLETRIREDPHPAVREYAAEYLAETASDTYEAVTLLAAVLARDPDAFVRARAATGLGELGTDRAAAVLERHGLSDRSDDVQRAARQALVDARGHTPEGTGQDSYDRRPNGGGRACGPPGSRGGKACGPSTGDDMPDPEVDSL